MACDDFYKNYYHKPFGVQGAAVEISEVMHNISYSYLMNANPHEFIFLYMCYRTKQEEIKKESDKMNESR